MFIRKKLAIAFMFIFIIGFVIWDNNSIQTTKYSYKNSTVPESFENFRILQISDLHNKNFGKQLIKKAKKTSPDIIVITGDLIDANRPNAEVALNTVKELTDIAPVYFVSGNHEKALNYPKVRTLLEGVGAVVLDNETVTINKNGEEIKLIGLLDYYFSRNMTRTLKKAIKDDSGFNILLSHQPDFMDEYSSYDIELVLSGHEHGGQFRIPFIGGVYSPHQGIFPKLSEGMHEENGTTIIISRGLGNSTFPLRLFNRPELVVIVLQKN